ncbi:hypothetical protein NQ318_021893 [Aromia moschata]|uniref:UDP-glucuronosyltransferase n=1 Tax=Aromia moschata TaxID=1265417 RepID=A0AAV8Z8T7_9CUCU|nr:hypothetical protein NQ318_021893 [Aromia moschata]
MCALLALTLFLTFTLMCTASNILVLSPTPSYSHQVPFFELWAELSLRGHKVTLITPDPLNNSSLTNMTEINMRHSYGLLKNNTTLAQLFANGWNFYDVVAKYISQILATQVPHPKFQKLIAGKDKFDLVMVSYHYPQLLVFGKLYNCPTILFSPYYLYTYYYRGVPSHPAIWADVMLPFHTPLDFHERLISAVFNLLAWKSILTKDIPEKEKFIIRHFNMSFSVDELVRDVDLIFVRTDPIIHGVRAFGPNIIEIGYERKPKYPKLLKVGLKEFLDNAKDGFIYFSLGSNVKSKDISRNLLKTIMEAIKEIPYTFLYKYEGDYLDEKPDNIRLVKWAPQYQILRHPNIKLFVTQGGFQSMEEAIYSAVPMVVIPFFSDQEHNGKLMESKGIAKVVNRKSLKKEELKGAIKEVLSNSSYREAIKRLRVLARDVPMTGLEKAIWWTEYVIRHKGAKHLRNPVADLPLYQYYLLDVIGFLLIVVVVSVAIAYFITKKLVMMVVMRLRVQRGSKIKSL